MVQGAVIKTYSEALEEKAREIGFGELPVNLIIYDGRITGFDQTGPAVVKFREKRAKE